MPKKSTNSKINHTLAKRVLSIVDKGLSSGLGNPLPGEMCIEAAVCYAMGLPHGDEPPCVSEAVRKLKIRLNDSSWSSNKARAKGMRRLAIAQLGTADKIEDKDFANRVVLMVIQKMIPRALRNTIKVCEEGHKEKLEKAAQKCEQSTNLEEATIAVKEAKAAANAAAVYAADAAAYAADAAAYAADAAADAAAYAAAYAADAAADAAAYAAAAYAAADASDASARDQELSFFAEEVVKILIDMKAKGTQWLDLTEAA